MASRPKKHRLLFYLIAGGGLIFFWRGIWGLADLYLVPHFPTASYVLSAIIGIILIAVDDRFLKELDNHKS